MAPFLLTRIFDLVPSSLSASFARSFTAANRGSDTIMTEAEQRGIDYLFKLRKSPYVKKLILQQHCKPGWEKTHAGWEALSAELKLSTWKQPRRVVLVRRRLQENIVIAPDSDKALPHQLSLLEPAEDMAAFEYSVLVTSLASEVVTIVQHYRDRADCENNFDEIKNQQEETPP